MLNLSYIQQSNQITNEILSELKKNDISIAQDIVESILSYHHWTEDDLTDVDILRINQYLRSSNVF